MTRLARIAPIATVAATALLLAGCGSNNGNGDNSTPNQQETPPGASVSVLNPHTPASSPPSGK